MVHPGIRKVVTAYLLNDYQAELRVRNDLIRIQIKHFRAVQDPDPDPTL
jgi:hypothetical protein